MTRAGIIGAMLLLAGCGGGGGPGPAHFQADGAACQWDVECTSGHCDSGLCCGKGTCCGTADDCPAGFRSDPTCTTTGDATDCQGGRKIAVCEQHVCGSSTLSDDSGCLGQVRACGTYKPVTCSAATVQPVATCASRCDAPGDCATGYTCVDHACAPIAGAGQACTGSGQGSCSSAALKCQNGVCCDAAAGTCCKDASSCSNGLACDTATSTCFTGCTSGSTDRCASASSYCASNACVAKQAPGATCTSTAQCASGICECFDAACTQKRCRSSWCGKCEYATSETACTAGLGSPAPVPDPNPADACGGTASACVAGTCRKADGATCSANTDCLSGVCRGGTCGAPSPLKGPCDAADGNADCTSGLACSAGRCLYAQATPSAHPACTENADCATGICAQGVCCGTSCTGACLSCALSGREGTCSPLPVGTTCNDGNSCTAGDACNAAGVCAGCTCNGSCVGDTVIDRCPTDFYRDAQYTCSFLGPGSCEWVPGYCW